MNRKTDATSCDAEISEDGTPTAVVKASRTSRDHGVRGLRKNMDASLSYPSFT